MPSLGEELELREDSRDIARDAVGMTINEFDDQALEEAVLIKEATGATVTAIALQADGIEQALRVAFARGADRALVVTQGDTDPYDARAAALLLADAIRAIGPDLVLTGVQTPYDLFGQTAPYLGAALGWPQVSVVSGARILGDKVRVMQEYSGGRGAVLDVVLPAVLGVQSATTPPRYVSMSRLRQAMSSTAEGITVASDGVAMPSTLESLGRVEVRQRATMLEGGPEDAASQLVDLLTERGVLHR